MENGLSREKIENILRKRQYELQTWNYYRSTTHSMFSSFLIPGLVINASTEKDNFKMCVKNTKNYNNVTPLQKALSNINGEELYIKDSGLGSWAFTTVSKIEGVLGLNKVLTINIDEILNQNNWDIVDIVKIDIEGAEKELFCSNFERWIPRTKCIIIELHDRMKKGCSKSFFKAISQYNFSCELRGENLILINLEF